MKVNPYARIGAIAYVLWGLLHIQAARMVYSFGQTLEPGMLQGRIFQGAWNLLFFALFAIAIAVIFNWRNNRYGYWLNLGVVSFADVGFIVLVLMPGYAPLIPGAVGPLLWIIALLFSTVGFLGARRVSVES